MESAKSFHKEYINQKSKAVFEKVEEDKMADDMVKGHCDGCGEPVSTTRAILNSGKWECGHCGSKVFDKDK
jgi:formylmethanofuran dehydrogenase subunit E